LKEGEKCGDFRTVDPTHFIPSMISLIVFYFITAPVLKVVIGKDPFSRASLAERRAAVLDFILAALAPVPGAASAQGDRK
jgi:hypothetical protein